jgi:hypothetical protein
MLIEERPIATIRPYDKNPRINDPAVDADRVGEGPPGANS